MPILAPRVVLSSRVMAWIESAASRVRRYNHRSCRDATVLPTWVLAPWHQDYSLWSRSSRGGTFAPMSSRRALTQAFGRVVHDARLRAKLSQERLAFLAKIHPTYVSQLERGLKSPTLEVVAALAKALHQRPHALIRAAEELDD